MCVCVYVYYLVLSLTQGFMQSAIVGQSEDLLKNIVMH